MTLSDTFGPPLYGKWPYPQANDGARWHEVTREQWDHFLGCVPPLRMARGWYACGEPARHDSRGVPVHAVGAARSGRYFIRELPLDKAASEVQALKGLPLPPRYVARQDDRPGWCVLDCATGERHCEGQSFTIADGVAAILNGDDPAGYAGELVEVAAAIKGATA